MSQSREDVVAGLYGTFARGAVPHGWTLGGDTPVRFDECVNAPVSLPAAHVPAGIALIANRMPAGARSAAPARDTSGIRAS